MGPGVHLHWALPAALTHGRATFRVTPELWNDLANEGFPHDVATRLQPPTLDPDKHFGYEELRDAIRDALPGEPPARRTWCEAWILRAAAQITFPAVPNRWVRVRIPHDRSASPVAWVIESDYLSRDRDKVTQPQSPAIPSPCRPYRDTDKMRPHYRFLGRAQPLDNCDKATSHPEPGEERERLDPLTAIGYGEPAFAAYYPNCRNVFGFCDKLEDIEQGTLSYVVMGWYSDDGKDPLHDGASVVETLEANRWLLPGTDEQHPLKDNPALGKLAGTLYAGMVHNVGWNKETDHVKPRPGAVQVVVRNTPAEAEAAYLAEPCPPTSTGGDDALTPEQKLQALQLGLLEEIRGSTDAEALVKHGLHESAFQPQDGGATWGIAKADEPKAPPNESVPGDPPAALPDVASDLHELNSQQAIYDRAQHQIDSRRDQLFTDWYRYLSLEHYTFNSSHAELPPEEAEVSFSEGIAPATDDQYRYQKIDWRYEGTTVLSPRALTTLNKQADLYFGVDSGGGKPVRAENGDPDLKRWVDEIMEEDHPILMQALGGFHDALLMRARGCQVPIYDPFHGTSANKPFVDRVAQAVGSHGTEAALPFNPYHPIRAGFVKLEGLRVIDAFGQYRDIDVARGHIVLPESLSSAQHNNRDRLILFPPRLVQPARLQFRWLSATDDAVEMNAHPDTSPICGWLVPNHLDRSLMIYEGDGGLVGELRAGSDDDPSWVPTAGAGREHNFANRHLEEFVNALQAYSNDQFGSFMEGIEDILHTMEPATYRQHDALAVLMGQPLALVRASLKLELKGDPAYNQSYETCKKLIDDVTEGKPVARETNGFTEVKFPVRLGQSRLLADGLVGYFVERDGGAGDYERDQFTGADPDEPPEPLELSCADEPVKVSMLVDPRAKVHATTGILPVKAIDIPPDQYGPALQAMKLAVLVNPLLTPANSLNIPVPTETGQQWSWVSIDAGGKPRPAETEFGIVDDRATPTDVPQRIVEGWLQVTPLAQEADEDGTQAGQPKE